MTADNKVGCQAFLNLTTGKVECPLERVGSCYVGPSTLDLSKVGATPEGQLRAIEALCAGLKKFPKGKGGKRRT